MAQAAIAFVAHAQMPLDLGTLPQSGGGTQSGESQSSGVQTNGIGAQIAGALSAGGAGPLAGQSTDPAWKITPAIGVQEEWTDNALQAGGLAGGQKQASFITQVTPSLSISGATSRLSGSLTYAPTASYYSSVSGQSQIAQNLDASGHFTLVPEQVFIDVRGFADQQALNGVAGPTGTVALSRQNTVQNYSFSITPYLEHRFGGWGTAQLGATDSETTQGALSGSLPGSGGSTQTLNTRQEYLSFSSGENFGRLLSNVQLQASQNSGNGPQQGATRDTATYQAGYAITHNIIALASIGWENINYPNTGIPGSSPVRIDDATWSVGTKLTPNPDSSITVQYGHQEGATAVSLDASYAPTVRTMLFAHYTVGITTAAEALQNSLATAQFDALGNPVNAQTGAPLQLTNNFYGTDGNVVFQSRNLSLTASWTLDRDVVQATVNRQQRTPLGTQTLATQSGANALLSGPDTGTYGSLSWSHEFSAALRGNVFGQYGIDDMSSGQTTLTSHLLVLSAGLAWQITDSLTGSFQYSFSSQTYQQQIAAATSNLVTLGVRKTF